jgi:hypothetical protein
MDSIIGNTFAITIIFIVISAIVGMIVKGRKKDKCLKDFSQYLITLEKVDGKEIWGRLRVENTGMELVYEAVHKDTDGHLETSYIVYKQEYGNIAGLLRYHNKLSEAGKKRRQRQLDRTYHPGFFRRSKRKIANIFRTIRDSVMEIVNMVISQAGKIGPAKSVLSSQGKYVSRMKQDVIGTVGTSYEPLLEKYIGHKVILELIQNEKVIEYSGVLKDYTAMFIEIMDVDYTAAGGGERQKADLVAPRKYGIIRHLGEKL